MGTRTFLAVELDESILDGLEDVCERLDDARSKIRWGKRVNRHLTMRFLGDVPDELIADVCDIALDCAALTRPFEFEVCGITTMPLRGALRMVWANIVDPSGELAALHELLRARLTGLGLKEETRGFRPHITLARVKFVHDAEQFRMAAEAYADHDFGTQRADRLVVYGSQMTRGGSIYTPLANAHFAED